MCAAIAMRTTADLPDELYRRAKAEAAVRGCNSKSANFAETRTPLR
jgi:hypothetical protein